MVTDSAAGIRHHIEALTAAGPRFGDEPGVAVALTYISGVLRDAGLPVDIQRYGSELYEVNLVAELPGVDLTAPLLDVGAHWDTVEDSPGADDNASGVAGVLAVATALAGRAAPQRGVRFCFFGGEESETAPFAGSTAHVEAIGNRPVEGAVILEMIGYRSTRPGSQAVPPDLAGLVEVSSVGDFVALVGDKASAGYVAALVEAAAAGPPLAALPLVLPGPALPMVSRSDHVPYWRSGRRAVMVTDTAEYRNPNYHGPDDTLSTLDFSFAARIAEAVTTAVELITEK